MASLTDLTARNLDIQFLELEELVEAAYNDFLNHYYGKRQRPDMGDTPKPPMAPQLPTQSQVNYGPKVR